MSRYAFTEDKEGNIYLVNQDPFLIQTSNFTLLYPALDNTELFRDLLVSPSCLTSEQLASILERRLVSYKRDTWTKTSDSVPHCTDLYRRPIESKLSFFKQQAKQAFGRGTLYSQDCLGLRLCVRTGWIFS